jgi:hypothetical protein
MAFVYHPFLVYHFLGYIFKKEIVTKFQSGGKGYDTILL